MTPRWLAPVLTVVLVTVGGAGLVLPVVARGGGADAVFLLGQGLMALVYGGIGLRILTRADARSIGWLLYVIGLCQGVAAVGPAYAVLAGASAGAVPGRTVALWLAAWVWFPSLGLLVTFVPLLSPDGRLPSRSWRWLARTAAATITAGTIALLVGYARVGDDIPLAGTPAGLPPVFRAVWAVSALLTVAGALGCVMAVVSRYRRSVGERRLQMKWFASGAVVTAVGVVSSSGPEEVNLLDALFGLLLAALPVALIVAIRRHRLYEIDRFISRTLSYVLVTAVLVGVYALSVVTLRALLAPLTGDADLAVAGSTLAVAALFGPVRRRVQRAVDRRFDRRRYDAAQAVEVFGHRLRDEVDLDAVAMALYATVATTVAPASAFVWVTPGIEAVDHEVAR